MNTNTTTSDPRPVNLLVVDDLEHNLLAMKALLGAQGWNVLTAGSGEEALELLLQHEVALALLDVQMPSMDGFALAELMRGAERTRHVPIIFLTAGVKDASRSFRGYEAGAVDFLYKPLDQPALLSKVRVFVALHLQQRELADRLAELKRLQKLNQTMTAVLTHDLRTPLLALTLSAEIVQRRAQDEPVRQAGERIKAAGQRMARMIEHLLNVSRMPDQPEPVQPQPGDLGTLVKDLLDEFERAHPGRRIVLEAEGSLQARFDADRVRQALASLLGTLAQHAPADEALELRLDGGSAQQLALRVANRSRLADTVQHQFHSALTRGDDADPLRTGLGRVDRIVRAHGGSVLMRSSQNEGTSFEILLPR